MPREVDPFRRHVEVVANKWKCKFCGKDFGGSATGIRAHLVGALGYGIKLCDRVDEHVGSQALKVIKGKSVADATNRGGASIEVMGRRSDGMGQIIVLGSDHASSPHNMQDSNQNVTQQPSCHWQNGIVAGAASVNCQYQETSCLVGMPVGDAEMPSQGPQPDGSIQRLNDEHGNEKTSSL